MPRKDIEKSREYSRNYNRLHREELSAKQRIYTANNRLAVNASRKKWRDNHLKQAKMSQRNWYYKHRERILVKLKEWRKSHLEESRIKTRIYYYRNREKIRERLRTDYCHRWHVYKGKAERNKWGFDITLKEFENLSNMPCHYCGDIRPKKNGVDRINSLDGYVKGNYVPCCKRCNRIKWDLTVEEFLMQCRKIVDFQNGKI